MLKALAWLLGLAYYLAASWLAASLVDHSLIVARAETEIAAGSNFDGRTRDVTRRALAVVSLGYLGRNEDLERREVLEVDAEAARAAIPRYALYLAVLAGSFLAAWLLVTLCSREPARRVAYRQFLVHLHGTALICLLCGLIAPMLTVRASQEVMFLGEVTLKHDTKSIVTTILGLWEASHAWLAVMLATFSFLVPGIKLLTGFVALTAMERVRRPMMRLSKAIGRWSMTDVFVVAVLFAFFAGDAGELTQAELGIGIYFFAAYALGSLAASELLSRYVNAVERMPRLAGPGGPPVAPGTG